MTHMEWLLSGDTGVSSITICAVMTDSNMTSSRADLPYDPSDFGRCYRLLKLFHPWRKRLQEVADKYKIWGPMVAKWDELTELYETELKNVDGRAPKLYELMQKLVDEGRLAAGWKRTSPFSWQGPER